MLVCHGPQGWKWFIQSPSVPDRWFPKEQLDAETYAFDIQSGSDPDSPMLHRIGADAWFDRTSADRLEVQEQTIRFSSNETLTLLVICDGEND